MRLPPHCTHTHTHTHTHTNTHIHTRTLVRSSASAHAFTEARAFAEAHPPAHNDGLQPAGHEARDVGNHDGLPAKAHTCTYERAHVRMCVCVRARVRARIHTYV